jgi:hypothetical protein
LLQFANPQKVQEMAMQQMMKQMMSQAGMKPPAGGARYDAYDAAWCARVSTTPLTTAPLAFHLLDSHLVAFRPPLGVLGQQPTHSQACPWVDSRA